MKLPPLKIRNLESKYPVIQAGMGVRIGMAELAAATIREGGYGTIASVGIGDVERGKHHFVEVGQVIKSCLFVHVNGCVQFNA